MRVLRHPLALFLLGSALFALAYGIAPLYYSNQNQYFLHGLAAAGLGDLSDDWLATTADPTPLFSAAVALTARYLHPWLFYAYHALLLGTYAAAMLGLFLTVAGPGRRARWPLFLLLFVAAHSAAARWLSYRLVAFDYPWFLQSGVAGQYALGAMLQPSAFGALLVAAVALFARGRPYLAAGLVAAAADVHSTYLLPGAFLTLGFLTSLLLRRQVRTAALTGAIALLGVLPAVAYVVTQFGPTSPETFAEAQSILVNLRIPHHARPDLWLDPVAAAQIVWTALGILLVRKTPLFAALAVPFALATSLTLLQVATGSTTLALLFPWRVSAILVPVSTTVILSRIVTLSPADPPLPASARVASLLGVLLLSAAGGWIMAAGAAFRSGDDELPLYAFARGQRAPGQLYLLPVRVPRLAATTRGSLSSDFKPPAEKKRDPKLIPIDLQRFRLATGVPIVIDFKSIPYKDADVLEWRDRLFEAEALGDRLSRGDRTALAELRRLGVTHVVRPAASPITDPRFHQVHTDPAYRVYRLP